MSYTLEPYDLYLLIRARFVFGATSGDYVFSPAAISLIEKPEPPPFEPTRHNRPSWAFDPEDPPEGPDTGPAPKLVAKAS